MCLRRRRSPHFLVEIGFDPSFREYRAAFVNTRYPVVMSASTETALKGRVMCLVSRYFRAPEAEVVFENSRAESRKGTQAA